MLPRWNLLAEEDLADRRADGDAADHAEQRRSPTTISDELPQPAAEVGVLPGAREAGQLRQQRGLHRLEQQDRDAGEEEADDEVGGRVPLDRPVGEHDRAERGE